MEDLFCNICGQEFMINEDGVSFHIDESGDIDHNADADHAPFSTEQEDAFIQAPRQTY